MIREARTGDVDRLMEIWLASNLEAHAFIDAQYWRRHADTTKHTLLPISSIKQKDFGCKVRQ